MPLTDPDSNDVIVFGSCFLDESMLEVVQEFQFQISYTYEVSTSGELKLKINHFKIDEILISERTLVRIEK
ncbi:MULTISPECIES: hypothetical protein [Bacillus]|nr:MULTISPECIES: hypothetical protein [Bacillus]TSI07948.1 hypothetical protein FOT98_25840 [Bacillus sp. HY001]